MGCVGGDNETSYWVGSRHCLLALSSPPGCHVGRGFLYIEYPFCSKSARAT